MEFRSDIKRQKSKIRFQRIKPTLIHFYHKLTKNAKVFSISCVIPVFVYEKSKNDYFFMTTRLVCDCRINISVFFCFLRQENIAQTTLFSVKYVSCIRFADNYYPC